VDGSGNTLFSRGNCKAQRPRTVSIHGRCAQFSRGRFSNAFNIGVV